MGIEFLTPAGKEQSSAQGFHTDRYSEDNALLTYMSSSEAKLDSIHKTQFSWDM